MILLKDKTNVTAPGGDYPYGDVKDNSGSNDGTPLNRTVLADMFQFFEKMFAESGETANGLLDDDNNGFQLYDAFRKLTKPYKVYSALISQSGTAAPTVTVLGMNEIGTIVWARTGVGAYSGTLVGAFPASKTYYEISTGVNGGIESFLRRVDDDSFIVDSHISGSPSDAALDNTPIEIRVYD